MEVASRQAGILHERIHLYLNGAMLMFVRSFVRPFGLCWLLDWFVCLPLSLTKGRENEREKEGMLGNECFSHASR